MHRQGGPIGLLRRQGDIHGKLGRRGVDRTVAARTPSDARRSLPYSSSFIAPLARRGSPRPPTERRGPYLQAKLLDLIDRGFEPGLRRRIAQAAEQHERGNLRPDGRLGLLRGRLGRQDLLAGLQLRGRAASYEVPQPPAGDSTTAGFYSSRRCIFATPRSCRRARRRDLFRPPCSLAPALPASLAFSSAAADDHGQANTTDGTIAARMPIGRIDATCDSTQVSGTVTR